MKLQEVWTVDPNKAFALFETFAKDESGFENECYGYTMEQFLAYLKLKEANAKGLKMPLGHVPSTTYILIDDEDNYVGIFNLRHCLNDFLENGPGHVGYAISKNYRRRGYATKGLELILKKAKLKGIDSVYLSCNKDNIASRKTIEKCKGVYRKETEKLYLFKIDI